MEKDRNHRPWRPHPITVRLPSGEDQFLKDRIAATGVPRGTFVVNAIKFYLAHLEAQHKGTTNND